MSLSLSINVLLLFLETEAVEKAAKEEAAAAAVVENTTPDYAAGLVSAQVLHPYPPPPRGHTPLLLRVRRNK